MTELSLIQNRYREVQQEITRTRNHLLALEKERDELDMAGRVIARLSGAEWPPNGKAATEQPEAKSGAKPEGIPTMPEMIVEALTEYAPLNGTEPKTVRDWIAKHYWPKVKGERVSTVLWRMWQRGELEKKDSRYMLPEKKEAADENPTKDTSTAPMFD